MTIVKRIELTVIPVMGMSFWFMTPVLPDMIPAGRLLLVASALLLFQSLVRDLWLLARKRRGEQTSLGRAARCMCIESTVGATGIVMGAILSGAGIGQPVSMTEWTWSVLVVLVLSGGFLMKDYVLEWSPWRIRRDKDHMNIVFTWKK